MRDKWPTIAVVGAMGLGLLVYLFVYSVRVDEVAVHKRFGTVIRVIRPELGLDTSGQAAGLASMPGVEVVTRAGWFFRLPWPFDRITPYDQRIRVVDGPLAQIQLADSYQLIPRVYATWRIVDPVAFEKSLKGDDKTAEKRLKSIIGNQTASVFGSRHLRELVNTDAAELKFDEIEDSIFQGVKASLDAMDNSYGVEVSSLGITWLALPEGTTQAVFDRMGAERARLAEKHRAEGESEKSIKIAQADATRKKMLAEAEADAKRIRAEAETEAAQYYETFAQDEDLAIFLRELAALKSISQNAADMQNPITFVLTPKTPPFSILEGGAPVETKAAGEADLEGK